MKQRLFTTLLLILSMGIAATAQTQQKTKFAIASFGQDPFDTTPTNPQYEKVDGNGARYAIIKVTSTNPEDDLRAYRFNFGQLNSLVEEHDGQLWVYVQRNAKLVTITREGYQTIDKHDLGLTIEAGKTYIMQLASAGITVANQMVMFNVSPANSNAKIIVKSEKSGAREEDLGSINASGMLGKSLPMGTYTYRVVANDYHPSEGRFTLNDKSSMYIEVVELNDSTPKYIRSIPEGAKLYINGNYVGTTPHTIKLPSGDYHLKLTHKWRVPFNKTIHLDMKAKEVELNLAKSKMNSNCFYIQGFYGVGMGPMHRGGAGIGFYLHNINLEVDFPFFWGPWKWDDNPSGYGYYSPSGEGIAIKLGYGFILGAHFRLTPQIGYLGIQFNNLYGHGYLRHIKPSCITIGGRFEYKPFKHFGLFVAPNLQVAVAKRGVYKQRANEDDEVKRWGTGLYLGTGIFFSF